MLSKFMESWIKHLLSHLLIFCAIEIWDKGFSIFLVEPIEIRGIKPVLLLFFLHLLLVIHVGLFSFFEGVLFSLDGLEFDTSNQLFIVLHFGRDYKCVTLDFLPSFSFFFLFFKLGYYQVSDTPLLLLYIWLETNLNEVWIKRINVQCLA